MLDLSIGLLGFEGFMKPCLKPWVIEPEFVLFCMVEGICWYSQRFMSSGVMLGSIGCWSFRGCSSCSWLGFWTFLKASEDSIMTSSMFSRSSAELATHDIDCCWNILSSKSWSSKSWHASLSSGPGEIKLAWPFESNSSAEADGSATREMGGRCPESSKDEPLITSGVPNWSNVPPFAAFRPHAGSPSRPSSQVLTSTSLSILRLLSSLSNYWPSF